MASVILMILRISTRLAALATLMPVTLTTALASVPEKEDDFMKTITFYVLLLCFSIFIGIEFTSTVRAQAGREQPVAYLIRRVEQSQRPDGTLQVLRIMQQAQRADGSTASGYANADPKMPRRVKSAPEGISAVIVDAANLMSLELVEAQHRPLLSSRPVFPECSQGANERPVGEESFVGFKVYKFQLNSKLGKSLPGGFRIEQTVWRAPSLNCVELKTDTKKLSPEGLVTGRTIIEAESVTLGEPPILLFAINRSYHNVSPSELYRQNLDMLGQQVDTSAASWKTLDDRFAKNHP